MNPIMQLLSQQSGPSSIFNVINSIKNARNPQEMLSSMAQTNPQVQQVMSYINSQGGDAK